MVLVDMVLVGMVLVDMHHMGVATRIDYVN